MTVPFFLMQKRLSMLSMLPVAVERSNWGRPMRWIKIVITEVFILLVVGTLDLNGFSQSFKKIAATDVGTIITNTSDKTATLSLQNPSRYVYHGSITGNTNIEHTGTQKSADSSLIIDGNINTRNDITVRNSQLRLQGHATSHAIFREGPRHCYVPGVLCDKDYVTDFARLESEANKKNNSAYKTNNQVASFDQPDWETRHFRFKTLNLENSEFTTARNSVVEGDIVASNSTLKLGATFRCSLICMMASISPVMVLASARTFVKDAQQMMAVAAIQAKLHCKRLHAGHQQPVHWRY
ncbi:hypothetical protein ACVV4I_03760 [Escherichia coli]